ncbi:hypothetical protein ACEI25_001427 [Photobacterium damselae]
MGTWFLIAVVVYGYYRVYANANYLRAHKTSGSKPSPKGRALDIKDDYNDVIESGVFKNDFAFNVAARLDSTQSSDHQK